MNRRIGIIGNHKITIKCLEAIKKHQDVEIVFVIFNPGRQNPGNNVHDYCEKNDIFSFGTKKVNSEECTQLIRQKEPDLILSISNYWILSEEILSIPKNGVINFHNGPPSRYQGINIPSWVILNGENHHGVMWHYAEKEIDSGDVIAFEMFELEPDETAATLMVKCINKGILLFNKILPDIVSNRLTHQPQESTHSYFSLRDFPENQGLIDLTWTYEKISRTVRGLNYLPFPNPFCYAKIRASNIDVIINEVSWISNREDGIQPGTIILINDEEFQVACMDAILNISNCMDENLEELSPLKLAEIFNVETGQNLTSNSSIHS